MKCQCLIIICGYRVFQKPFLTFKQNVPRIYFYFHDREIHSLCKPGYKVIKEVMESRLILKSLKEGDVYLLKYPVKYDEYYDHARPNYTGNGIF